MADLTTALYSTPISFTSLTNSTADSQTVNPSTISTMGPTIVLAVSLIIDIVGLIGNAFVVFVIFKTKSLRDRLPNQFIVNQSVIDFCSCVSLIFSVLPKKQFLQNNLEDDLYCKLYLSKAFSWGLVFSSTYSLIALTIERYLSIVYPVWHKQFCTKHKAWVVMSLTWVFGLVEGVAHAVPTSFIQDGVCYPFSDWPSNWARIVAGLITCTLHYIMPMAVLAFCYGKMVLVISGRIKKVAPASSDSSADSTATGNKDQLWSTAKRNVIHALTIVGVLFALCWSMNQIYYLMMCLGYPPDFTSTFYNITVQAIYMNSCVNPIVYFVKYDQFKRAVRAIVYGKEVTPGGETGTQQ